MRIATIIALVYLPANLVLVRYCPRYHLFMPYLLNFSDILQHGFCGVQLENECYRNWYRDRSIWWSFNSHADMGCCGINRGSGSGNRELVLAVGSPEGKRSNAFLLS